MPYKEKKVEKLYYTIGEAADILDVPVSTVRFWDNEFEILKPLKNKKGNRMFTQADMRNLRIIHHLLKDEGMTLQGVKKKMSFKWDEADFKLEINESLQRIRSILIEIKDSI
ncbi:MAG TPA: MerR family transcriptional regulator [Bacteroidales bacterium]|nr:MerR family transcriptional regulator [Bacteroidales bacterium]